MIGRKKTSAPRQDGGEAGGMDAAMPMPPKMWRVLWTSVIYAVLGAVAVVAAAILFWFSGLEAPERETQAGKAVLTVQSQHGQVQFDRRALELLPQVTYKVSTPWYLRKVSFRGPLLRDVLAAAGADGDWVSAVAVNDYAVEFPVSEALEQDAILALTMDGRLLSPRERGPSFLVFPYDALPEDRLGYYYSLSIWQLDWLTIR